MRWREDSDRCLSRRLKCRVGRRESKATFFNKHRSSKEAEERGRSKPRREPGSLRRMRGKEKGTLRRACCGVFSSFLRPSPSVWFSPLLRRFLQFFFALLEPFSRVQVAGNSKDHLPLHSLDKCRTVSQSPASVARFSRSRRARSRPCSPFSFAHFCCRPSPLLLLGQSRSSWEAGVLLLGLASAQPQPSHLVNLPSVTSFRRFSPARTTNAAETLLPPTKIDVESVDGAPAR
jgi:hypothetical protein